MNARAVRALVRRDLTRVAGSKPVLVPLGAVPLALLIVMPVVIGLLPTLVGAMAGMREVEGRLDQLPAAVIDTLPADPATRVAALALVYLLAPLYLLVPMMVAIVIAADSFAGERERRTLELLLNAPVTDAELFLGKILSAWIPALAVGVGGAVVYGLVADLVTGVMLFPNLMWTALAVWVAPGVAALGLGAAVIASSRVAGFQEANQLAGVVVLPLVGLMIAQGAGALLLSSSLVLALGAAIWVVAAALLIVGVRTFNRPALGEKL